MENRKKILINIFEQAETYLKEIGEFAPFGATINLEEQITPLGYYSNEAIVDSSIAIEELQEGIEDKFIKEIIKLGAIGVNVSIQVKGEPSEALLVKITEDGINWSEDYYLYKLEEFNNVVWK